MSQNPMPYSGHPTPNATPMHFRGAGVSKKLYNTSTQPRNVSYNHQQMQHHTQPYERRHNVIDDIGLEVGPHQSVSQPFNESHGNGRATTQRRLPSKFLSSSPDSILPTQSQGNA